MLNPIELAWSGLKNFVRKHNTDFRLSEVRTFASEWIRSLTADSRDVTIPIPFGIGIDISITLKKRYLEKLLIFHKV